MSKSKLIGDWERAGRILNEKMNTFHLIGDEPLQECAELYLETLKKNIDSQALKWEPLKEEYLKRKKSLGLDTRTLISTGSYLGSLRVHEVKTGGIDKKSVFVGGSKFDKHEPSGLSMSDMGAILEYGTKDGRIPARPHYRPTWQEVLPQCRNIWLKAGRDFFRWG